MNKTARYDRVDGKGKCKVSVNQEPCSVLQRDETRISGVDGCRAISGCESKTEQPSEVEQHVVVLVDAWKDGSKSESTRPRCFVTVRLEHAV